VLFFPSCFGEESTKSCFEEISMQQPRSFLSAWTQSGGNGK
jgi:hypothetical protein